jgi:hypothetical protein
MPTVRALSSVAHNTAHHAASSMSWLHPHSCQAARDAGLGELRFNLLAPSPLSLASISEPLRMASEGFQKKFIEMLEEHGFTASQLAEAVLLMSFPTSDKNYCVTTCRLETIDGKVFEKSSSSLG